jgi:hypothetical protein
MNLLKKLAATLASFAVVMTAALSGVPAANAAFTDVAGHWSEMYVNDLADAGIISTENADGSLKTMYYPNNSLTRAELTKLAIEAFYGDTVADLADAFADEAAPSFTDVPADAWYFDYVEIAKGLDIVGGFADGTFAPNNPITRAAALKVLLLTGDIETVLEPETPFTDVSMGDWFYEYVTTAYNHCIVNGTSPSTFSPAGNITRGEVAKVLKNAMDVANGEEICMMGDDDDDDDDDDDMVGDDDDDDDDDDDEVMTTMMTTMSLWILTLSSK